jgi:RNA polymerase sigma-70 factor (ECF subfamily)
MGKFDITSQAPIEQLSDRGQISVGHYGGSVADGVEQCNNVAFGNVLHFAAVPQLEHGRRPRGILRNDGEAEDVVQETYVRAFTHLEQFRGDSSLSTWLSRIAMNEALGRLRRQRPGVELDSLPQGTLEAQIIQFPLASSDDPEKTMAQREIQRVVEHAIDELPEAFRLVFITRVIEGMNVEETADILGVKPETVKTRLHRARTMLLENVEKKIGPVVMEAFPFAGKRCERLTDAVLKRLGFTG